VNLTSNTGEGPLPKLEHGEHSVTTLYEYDGRYYDRKIKDFFGFQTVKLNDLPFSESDATKKNNLH